MGCKRGFTYKTTGSKLFVSSMSPQMSYMEVKYVYDPAEDFLKGGMPVACGNHISYMNIL